MSKLKLILSAFLMFRLTTASAESVNSIRNDANKYFESTEWKLFLTSDFNNDGIKDFVIGGPVDSCGASGLCPYVVFISQSKKYKLFELGSIYGVEIKNGKLLVDAHKEVCKTRKQSICELEVIFKDNKFQVLNKKIKL